MSETGALLVRQTERIAALESEVAALRQQVEGMREDAERYRWLRSEYALGLFVASVEDGPMNGEYLDAKVDAARKESSK